ncbi:MAG: hypothetical protein ACRDPG_02670 [Nocardioidaceae bacterium]
MRPLLLLVLLLASLPVSLIVAGVWTLRSRGGRHVQPVEAVVRAAPASYKERHTTVAYTAPGSGAEVVGETDEGFIGVNVGDPITIWVDPANPRSFRLSEPAPFLGIGVAAIAAGCVMLILLFRMLQLA